MGANRSNPEPIYKRLAAELAEQIRRGKRAPGEQLPSERELGLDRNISRMTARQVYQRLAEGGLVSRSDRRGWFVAEQRPQFSLTRSVSFINNLTAQGVMAKMEVLESVQIPAPDLVRKELRLRSGQRVQSIRRLLRVRDEPALVETLYFRAERFPGIADLPLGGSLLPVWRDTYKVVVGRSENTISGGYLSDKDARSLKVRKGSPGISLSQTILDQHDQPLAYARQNWRIDIAEFFISVKFE